MTELKANREPAVQVMIPAGEAHNTPIRVSITSSGPRGEKGERGEPYIHSEEYAALAGQIREDAACIESAAARMAQEDTQRQVLERAREISGTMELLSKEAGRFEGFGLESGETGEVRLLRYHPGSGLKLAAETLPTGEGQERIVRALFRIAEGMKKFREV